MATAGRFAASRDSEFLTEAANPRMHKGAHMHERPSPMPESSEVRARAAAFYEKALLSVDACCDAGANGIAAAAGYTDAERTALPADAVGNSFGCGNPLAFAGGVVARPLSTLAAERGSICSSRRNVWEQLAR